MMDKITRPSKSIHLEIKKAIIQKVSDEKKKEKKGNKPLLISSIVNLTNKVLDYS